MVQNKYTLKYTVDDTNEVNKQSSEAEKSYLIKLKRQNNKVSTILINTTLDSLSPKMGVLMGVFGRSVFKSTANFRVNDNVQGTILKISFLERL